MAPNSPLKKHKRLRIFAGPNGSGKTTILKLIDDSYDLGVYINADEIEKQLRENSFIDLFDYGINNFDESRFKKQLQSHSLLKKAKSDGYHIDIDLQENKIVNLDKKTHSYEAALIADIIRHELLAQGKKMSFETVMSHSSKIEFFKQAKENGYKVYLYFICTESAHINVERVGLRVEKGGHPVDPKKIVSRYKNSLALLKDTIPYCYRTFIFDNSEDQAYLILEVTNKGSIEILQEEIPHWVDDYLLSYFNL